MPSQTFPLPLASYPAPQGGGLLDVLAERIRADPFNLVASAIFLLAIIHTFLTPLFRRWAHAAEGQMRIGPTGSRRTFADGDGNEVAEVSFAGQVLHFLGEVEAVFGIWAVVLLVAALACKGTTAAVSYIDGKVDFTEPLFVMVVMALASTRPMMRAAENALLLVASLGGATLSAWWLAILMIGPLFGSFITEPGAMTISAILLGRQFYHYKPSAKLSYATIGLLFVNVSVGGTLTQFAAPPMVMAAGPWHWDLAYMFLHFGWRALIGIVVATSVYYFAFRKEFEALDKSYLKTSRSMTQGGGSYIPPWIMAAQIGFLAFTVAVAKHPPLFIGGFLFFLAFAQATAHHQKKLDLRTPLMVGFFLASLVVHGGLQSWWIEPVLKSLGRVALFTWATILTGFNDNAAITYLATLVPGFTEQLKFAVVAGAVTGGGLTVIANAPNPAGQLILQRFFPGGVSPLRLMAAAIPPTLTMAMAFMLT
ncbi:MAG TPA: putative Na+/H+ antiporter [Opitutaceae bacterium]